MARQSANPDPAAAVRVVERDGAYLLVRCSRLRIGNESIVGKFASESAAEQAGRKLIDSQTILEENEE